MEISASQVKDLREKTGAGIMDCKTALAATDGDIEKAIDYLREKGLSSAAKKTGRIASDGLIASHIQDDGNVGALLEVNCETDFVAKTEDFQKFVKELVEHVVNAAPVYVKKGEMPEAERDNEELCKAKCLTAQTLPSAADSDIESVRQALVAKIGENISIRRFIRYALGEDISGEAAGRDDSMQGLIGSYVHAGGKIGILLEVNCESGSVCNNDTFQEFVKDLTLQIAAANPLYLTRDDVPEPVVEKEKAILRAQALESGKPDKVIDNIVKGRLEKFYTENCLLEQLFVKDPDIKINKLRGQLEKDLGEKITIRRYVRYQLGEGLEKRSDDLAGEVAKQVKKAGC